MRLMSSLAAGVGAAVLILLVAPLAAQDAARKPPRQQELARLITENGQTLAKAIEASEALTSGIAINARADLRNDQLGFTVTCVVDGKPVEVKVDGRTGEASSGNKRQPRKDDRPAPREGDRDGKIDPGAPVEP